jgi:DNA-binding transcriptional LysR family regulator
MADGRPHVELRHLRYFVAVAEELNFTRAAARLHMAQPPLSAAIAQLEQRLGVRLLERSTREVRLTAVGARVLEVARRTLAGADELAALAVGAEPGPLRLSYTPATSYGVAPALVHAVAERLPGLEVAMEEVDAGSALRRVRRGESDVALLRAVPADAGLDVRTIAEERLGVLVGPGDPWAELPELPSAALGGRALVVPERDRDPDQLESVLAVLRRHGAVPTVLDERSRVEGTLARVARGEAIALLTASGAGRPPGGVHWVPLREPAATVPLRLARRGKDAASLPFAETAEAVGAELAERRPPVVPALL